MIYAFEAEITAPKGKLSREDRAEIRDYMAEVRLEAADPEKAVRQLAKQLQGKLKGDVADGGAVIALPDYGSACTMKVRAHEET